LRSVLGSKSRYETIATTPADEEDFFTVLSTRDCVDEVRRILEEDPRLERCFVD